MLANVLLRTQGKNPLLVAATELNVLLTAGSRRERAFLEMRVAIALAALSCLGARGNDRNLLTIGGSRETGIGLPFALVSSAAFPHYDSR